MRHKNGIGFTLIELLVVVAVILVLAAFLVPAINKAKEAGRVARCASNLRQLQIATLNYSTDNSSLPRALSVVSAEVDGDGNRIYKHYAGWISYYNYTNGHTQAASFTGNYDWRGAQGLRSVTNGVLWPYVREKEAYLCPTFALRSVCGQTDAMRSYSMNTNAGSAMVGAGSFMNASQLLLYGDDRFITNGLDGGFVDTEIGRWHGDRTGACGVVVFADGHVEKR